MKITIKVQYNNKNNSIDTIYYWRLSHPPKKSFIFMKIKIIIKKTKKRLITFITILNVFLLEDMNDASSIFIFELNKNLRKSFFIKSFKY